MLIVLCLVDLQLSHRPGKRYITALSAMTTIVATAIVFGTVHIMRA
jgi:hypothetical protein